MFLNLTKYGVYTQLNTTAEVVFEREVNSMLTEAGCKNTECFLFVYINNQIDGTNNWLSFADIKDSSVQKAQIAVSITLSVRFKKMICFSLLTFTHTISITYVLCI